ncbi:MAG: peptidase S9, partial [Bacteroidales bacterium]|nr:peptidase S9 [Bacteroidales bacterium]
MKKHLLLAATLMAILSMTACKTTPADSGEILKPENIAADGHFTAEIMHQLGKVSDPQVSPDGSRILFGVTYTSIEQNKGVRQLFVMDIDGTGRTQITHSG